MTKKAIEFASGDYLSGLPEQLAVRGLRAWMFCYEFNDFGCMDGIAEFYENALGGKSGAYCNALLARWVRQLWKDTPQKLGFYPPCCRQMSGDECMAAGVLAALQHGDAETARLASSLLLKCGPDSSLQEHLLRAADYAAAMAACGQILMRVPRQVIEHISALRQDSEATRH